VVRAAWRHAGFFRPNVALGLEFNTDTLGAVLDAWNVGFPGLSLGVFGRTEALLALVSSAPVFSGVARRDLGFFASYAQAGARVAYTTLEHLTLEGEAAVRGWWFMRSLDSDKNLRLSRPFVAIEPRLRIKWVSLVPDEGRLGLYQGLALVLETGADLRSQTTPWGGLEGGPPDPRNALPADALPRRVLLTGRAAMPVMRMGWLSARAEGGWGLDEDDLTRARVGGMNPYVVEMPGAAWGEFVTERFGAVHMELGLRPKGFLYVGVAGHAAVVNDPERRGAFDDVRILRGASVDARLSLFRVVRLMARVGGNIDVTRPQARGALGALLWADFAVPP
jgi:hypothetical protein